MTLKTVGGILSVAYPDVTLDDFMPDTKLTVSKR
jgi:hypothetical protein